FIYFFFQAEDGIRDFHVTGVQTCALPIYLPLFEYDTFKEFQKYRPFDCKLVGIELISTATYIKDFTHPKQACYLLGAEDPGLTRSEERRVGKECRSVGWS